MRPALVLLVCLFAGAVPAQPVPTTARDFHVPGSQVGDVDPFAFLAPDACANCHRVAPQDGSPSASWSGSKMALAGRNPLFFAQLATANQDVAEVGSFCLRCHVPKSVITGAVLAADGSALGARERDGVDCQFCHALVDPVYRPGQSPTRDQAVLAALESVPQHVGNAMFVLDPDGVRRGPRPDAVPLHELEQSPYHRSSALCGNCHEVGNVAVSRQADGSYRYNALDTAEPGGDPALQFPLERTYTEWKLSDFARTGVDLGGRFGGTGAGVVSECQDCHMPRRPGRAAAMGPERTDLRSHEFAGASVWTLDLIERHWQASGEIDAEAIERSRQRSIDMLTRAVDLELTQIGGALRVRIVNQSGHKLPTGHIEGRRAWLRVRVRDAQGGLLREYGGYDLASAEFDAAHTVVYEMVVGLSPDASAASGRPAGPSGHMALADTIFKDSRIPPRGFSNAAFEAAGAPAVGHAYADGQHWDDVHFWLPDAAAQVEVTAFYQTASREYIEELREGNHSDHWGETLYQLWLDTGRGPPLPMAEQAAPLQAFLRGDFDADGEFGEADAAAVLGCLGRHLAPGDACLAAEATGDDRIDCADLHAVATAWRGPGAMPGLAACTAAPPPAVIPGVDPAVLLVMALLVLWPGLAAVRRAAG